MLNKIIDALGNMPLGYEDDRDFVRSEAQAGRLWQEAGVLVLLVQDGDGLSFVLNKRSQNVSQPGDLCWPGGHPKFFSDRIMADLVIPRILPMRKGPGFAAARKRRPKTFRQISFFLANALRETWEEMGIGPRRVEFLGALPSYRLVLRKKIVYPMVGFLSKPKEFKIGREIEKNIFLPLSSLCSEDSYGTYTLVMTGKYRELAGMDTWDAPCFAIKQENSQDEILWGATFKMLMSLMKVVFDFDPPTAGPIRASAELYPSRAK